jgi:hypothetical protein
VSSPKRDSSIAAPSVTLMGQPRPNSAWLNRYVNACFTTAGYGAGHPRTPERCDIAWMPNSPYATRSSSRYAGWYSIH